MGKPDVEGQDRRRESDKGKALASSKTLNRVELTPADATRGKPLQDSLPTWPDRGVAGRAVSRRDKPGTQEIILDFDATDDPLYCHEEGQFFHGYCDCYCYIPLYVTCGDHLLVAKLRPANQDASAGVLEVFQDLVNRIRRRWPQVRIIVRGDAGFARELLMAYREEGHRATIVHAPRSGALRENGDRIPERLRGPRHSGSSRALVHRGNGPPKQPAPYPAGPSSVIRNNMMAYPSPFGSICAFRVVRRIR